MFLVENREPFDLAFLDPPYRTGILQRALPMTANAMNKGGTIVCENPSDEEMPENAGILSVSVPTVMEKLY